jgi:hypothetical protein
MEVRHSPVILRRMDPPGFHVIVVRAWRDPGGLRIRLLADGGSERQWVVNTIAEACAVLGSVLAELLVEPPVRLEPSERSSTTPQVPKVRQLKRPPGHSVDRPAFERRPTAEGPGDQD